MSKGRILVVEPDFDTRNMLDAYFTGQGYQVLTCDKAQDALDLTQTQLPSLILTEIDLPDKSGYDLIQHWRTTNRTSYVPIIAMSHRGSREDKIKALELGIDDYAVKPFAIEELKERIDSILHPKPSRIPHTLTGLPMGHIIEDHLRKIMQENSHWVYVDVKIVAFEPYREIYGWQKGDELLKRFSKLLQEIWQGDFIGHPGGDNFIIITEQADYKPKLEALSERFAQAIKEFYQESEIEAGFIVLQGEEKPLMSISFGVCDNAYVKVRDIREITELAADDRRRKDPNYRENNDDDADILTAW